MSSWKEFRKRLLLVVATVLVLFLVGKVLVIFAGFDDMATLLSVKVLGTTAAIFIFYRP